MINFEIQFSYNEIIYKASVQKPPVSNSLPVQYHVTAVTPVIPGLPDPLIFVHEGNEDGFTHTITFDYHITDNILKEIATYCNKNNIPFTT